MDPIRDRLAHVLWIGGAPNVGKTTLARLLAGKYDLKIYNSDWHHVREHRDRPGGVPTGWDELTMDQRWVHPSPQELADREIASWTARCRLVVEDIRALPLIRPVVAEGPALFPWCVAPLIRSVRQAIFFLPTPAFRERVLARRYRDTSAGERPNERTSEPDRARRKGPESWSTASAFHLRARTRSVDCRSDPQRRLWGRRCGLPRASPGQDIGHRGSLLESSMLRSAFAVVGDLSAGLAGTVGCDDRQSFGLNIPRWNKAGS